MAQRAAKQPHTHIGKKRKPMSDFLMVILSSGIARGSTATATESHNMAAIRKKVG